MKPSRRLPFFIPALIGPGAVLYGVTQLAHIEALWLFAVLGTMLTLFTLLVSWTLSGLGKETGSTSSPYARR